MVQADIDTRIKETAQKPVAGDSPTGRLAVPAGDFHS